MKPNTLNFDVLHNFISPVTGRVLCTRNYVLYGDKLGIATPSPIIIDIRLELIKLRNLVNSIIDGTIILPIGSLPNLTYQYLWTGDINNRPIEVQRIILNNLPPFLDLTAIRQNFGIYNLYTGQGLLPNPLNLTNPTTTLRIDPSNLPNLTEGRMWIGVLNYLPPTISFSPPSITGSLNWDPLGNPIIPGGGIAYAVPMEIGLDPMQLFIGNTDPTKMGQITVTTALYIDNLPNLTSTRIWRGDISNRPVESDDLTNLETEVASLAEDIGIIQDEIFTIQSEITTIQGQLILIQGELTIINATLYTPITGLVFVVPALAAVVATNTANIIILFNRTLDQIPLAQADVNINNHRLINVSDPINPLDAVNLETLETYIGGAGTVTNVSGTAGQIDVINNTTTPVISIDPTYVGQTSITTLGTITTGTWEGNLVGLAYGGTNAALSPSVGGIVYSTSSALAILGGTATSNQVLLSGSSSSPSWSTATYPATTTINQLLYSSSANVITGLPTANNSVLTTNGSGIPSWTTLSSGFVTSVTGTANQIDVSPTTGNVVISIDPAYIGQTSITTLGTITTGTWNGNTITVPYGGTGDTSFTAYTLIAGGTTSTGALQSIAAGTSGQVLTSTGSSSLPTWTTPTTGTVTSVSGTTGQIDVANGTTTPVISIDSGYIGQTSIITLGTITTGIWNGTNIALNHGGTNAALTASNGGIVYSTASAMGILAGTATANQVLLSGASAAPTWSTATYPPTTTVNQLLYSSSTNTITGLATANNSVLTTNGSGVPSWSTTSSNFVTSITGTANQITASSSTGAITLSIATGYVGQTSITTLGTIATGTWNGTNIALNHGGTNAALTASNGGIVYSTASAMAILAGTATAHQVLLSGASAAPTWSTATYPTTTTANQLLYSSSTNTIAGLATANNSVLTTNGSGVPSWTTLSSGFVTSVTGTANQIDVSPTTGNVVISIDPAYIGQTSITTLGTITTGTWNGTNIALNHGGTNAALTASNGGIVYSTASAMGILAGTATANQVLLSGASAAPTWSTATYPPTTTVNQLLYSSSTNTIAGLATANDSFLTTNGSGVPSWTTLSSGLVTSVTGTANQIIVSPTTGAVVVSLPNAVILNTSLSTPRLRGSGSSLPSVTLGSSTIVGTGATFAIAGSGEVGGVFVLTTGTGITVGGGAIATFTLASATPNNNYSVVFQPSAQSSASLSSPVWVSISSNTQFNLNTVTGVTLSASTQYRWLFQIISS